MNRQVVAFLSLFSLVLVLSVYYVISPGQQEDSIVSTTPENVENVSQETYYFSSLALARNERHQEIIDEQVALIASNDSTPSKVVEAKEAMQKEEEIMLLEEALEEVVMQCDFAASYVEILDTYYNILAYRPNMKADDELLAVDTIFQTTDQYLQENEITWIYGLSPVVEFRY